MAAVYPPRPGLSRRGTSTKGQSTGPDQPKLRNSCHACASCKLKCSQEKPVCSRCAKRGLSCEYVVAKRGGRKPTSRSNSDKRGSDVSNCATNAKDSVHLPSQADWFAPSTSNLGTNAPSPPEVMHHFPKTNISGSSDMLQDFFGPVDPTLSSASTDVGTDLDDLFTSPTSFSTQMSDVNVFDTAFSFPPGIDSSSNGPESLSDAFPGVEDAFSELLAHSIPNSPPKNQTSPSNEVQNSQEARVTDSPCSCLIQALGFMKQLFPSSSSTCMTWATQGLDNAIAIPTIQAVIARNETTIEAVSTMLSCSCSQDGYLLAIMSLIVFKVLGWYATVARKTPGLQGPQACRSPQLLSSEQVFQDPIFIRSYCLDGADSARMAAQLVLSELHRVRRLVDQLSSKLKLQAVKMGRGGGMETPESSDLENEMALAVSTVMYDQLDVDLKKRLRALSRELINRLRTL